jgi:hypothetical protein
MHKSRFQREEKDMNVNQDLVGKTITGVIASVGSYGSAREIWMLQFSDGTHVEFVSPGARKALRQAIKQPARPSKSRLTGSPQLVFNVA